MRAIDQHNEMTCQKILIAIFEIFTDVIHFPKSKLIDYSKHLPLRCI